MQEMDNEQINHSFTEGRKANFSIKFVSKATE